MNVENVGPVRGIGRIINHLDSPPVMPRTEIPVAHHGGRHMSIHNLMELGLDLYRMTRLQHSHRVAIPVDDVIRIPVNGLCYTILRDVARRAEAVDGR